MRPSSAELWMVGQFPSSTLIVQVDYFFPSALYSRSMRAANRCFTGAHSAGKKNQPDKTLY